MAPEPDRLSRGTESSGPSAPSTAAEQARYRGQLVSHSIQTVHGQAAQYTTGSAAEAQNLSRAAGDKQQQQLSMKTADQSSRNPAAAEQTAAEPLSTAHSTVAGR